MQIGGVMNKEDTTEEPSELVATKPATRRAGPGKKTVFAMLSVVLILLILEGLSSALLLPMEYSDWASGKKSRVVAEDKHVQYDADLGWSHIPGTKIKNMYGEGRDLTINARGFRDHREIVDLKEDEYRLIFLGDSFTLGFGVGDQHTIGMQLEGLGRGVRTLNLGQGGYGIDQAFLWYKRDASDIETDWVIFQFIGPDFLRTAQDRFVSGYHKPLFVVEDGALTLTNVPVPERLKPGSELIHPGAKARYFRSKIALTRLLDRMLGRQAGEQSALKDQYARGVEISCLIFKEMQKISAAQNKKVLFVYIPTLWDFERRNSEIGQMCAEAVDGFCRKNNLPFYNLLPEVAALAEDERIALYLGAENHLGEAGTRYVAEKLDEVLMNMDPQYGLLVNAR